MGDLPWLHHGFFGFPLKALRHHAVILGSSGSGKTETLLRIAFGARQAYQLQVIYLDAKGETKRAEEESEDNAARFLATMWAAGAHRCAVFPSLFYNGWQGTPLELKNRLLSVVDFSESAYYGDVAANVLDLALNAPITPRSSHHLLANLRIDQLKTLYRHDRRQYQRVLALDKTLVEQVEMRYQVFFSALHGQLDGILDYGMVDAAYLRVPGFTLQQEAPRLGRFLIEDFIHYISTRRRPGVRTLFIIDEFNALRLREETSRLFEQCRSFGGSLIIAAHGFAGLGPSDYAERILNACSTFILHACSDPFRVAKRAGKKLHLETTWSEGADGTLRQHIRPRWVWKVPESAVIHQETGQAYWIYRGHAQQVQTAQVPITEEAVQRAWQAIRRQEAWQRQQQVHAVNVVNEAPATPSSANTAQPKAQQNTRGNRGTVGTPSPSVLASAMASSKNRAQGKQTKQQAATHRTAPSSTEYPAGASGTATTLPGTTSPPVLPAIPIPDPDDDEPDEL
jgi:hypothetical protein